MFSANTYIRRREKLKKDMGKGILLFLGNEESSMNYRDNFYPFRQDSSFLYFFGIDRPGLRAILDIDNNREILFGDNLTVEEMVWTGIQQPLEQLAQAVGVVEVQARSGFDKMLATHHAGQGDIHYLPPYRPEHVQLLSACLSVPQAQIATGASVKMIRAIVAQRSIKSVEEVQQIAAAVDTTVDMQLAALRLSKPGLTEARLAAEVQSIAIAAGGNLSFPTIMTQNGQILHNGYSAAELKEGKMVLCDCGAETAMHYAGDLTRTFPVGKKFSTAQKEVYEIVLGAHNAAVAALKPNTLFREIHLLACEKLAEGLKQLGIMKGDVREAVHAGAHALFFPCGLGHMMGLDTHDMENLGEPYVGYTDSLKKSTQFGLKSLRLGRALEQGFVVTVEPGLYFIPDLMDEWEAEGRHKEFIAYDRLKQFRTMNGIRIEEDFLITGTGADLLGKSLPKTAQGLEDLKG
jgi:Xaa-Pro aminopeptidase